MISFDRVKLSSLCKQACNVPWNTCIPRIIAEQTYMIELCKLVMMACMKKINICVFLKNQLMSMYIIIIGGLIKDLKYLVKSNTFSVNIFINIQLNH